jgi:hypothetical protein
MGTRIGMKKQLAAPRITIVQLANPGYVNRMKRSPDKTDFGDAQMLADLSRVNYLPKVWLTPQLSARTASPGAAPLPTGQTTNGN